MSAHTDRGVEGMTDLHARGIRFAVEWLARRGYCLDSVAWDRSLDPQVVASRGGRCFHIAVRTDRWPQAGDLECEGLAGELRDWATRHEAVAYLARISLRSSEAASADEGGTIVFERI